MEDAMAMEDAAAAEQDGKDETAEESRATYTGGQ